MSTILNLSSKQWLLMLSSSLLLLSTSHAVTPINPNTSSSSMKTLSTNTQQLNAISRFDISQQQAQALIDQALLQAQKQNFKISVAVVDRSGDLIAFSRHDQASKVTIEVAMGKARTAAYIQAPSKVFENFINQEQQSSMLSIPSLMPLQGGLPIYQHQQVIGAIGVSGAPGGQFDEKIAEETLKQFKLDQLNP